MINCQSPHYIILLDPFKRVFIEFLPCRDPCATDPDGRTALHYACTSKSAMSTDLVQRLLECCSVTGVFYIMPQYIKYHH